MKVSQLQSLTSVTALTMIYCGYMGAVLPTVVLGLNVWVMARSLNIFYKKHSEEPQGEPKVDIKATMKAWADKKKEDDKNQ